MKHLTLFQLTATITDIIDDIVDAEIAGETDENLFDELDSHYGARADKIEGYIHVIKNTTAAATNCRAEAEGFAKRAKALENLAKRLKETLHADLIKNNELTTTAGNFRIARHTGQPSVVLLVDASDLPTDYQRVKIEADKTELKNALKRGEIINGVELRETEHVRIKVR